MLGPAYCAAAVPVRTKMPVPTIAPRPMAAILIALSVFARGRSPPSALATISATDFRAIGLGGGKSSLCIQNNGVLPGERENTPRALLRFGRNGLGCC